MEYFPYTPRKKAKKNMSKTDKFWSNDHSTVQEVGGDAAVLQKFVGEVEGESFTVTHTMTVNSSKLAIADAVAAVAVELGAKPVIKSHESSELFVDARPTLLAIVSHDNRSRSNDNYEEFDDDDDTSPVFRNSIRTYSVTACGNRHTLDRLLKEIAHRFKTQRLGRVKWWYSGQHGQANYKTTYLENPGTLMLPEFYPDLGMSPEKLMEEYLTSDESVLLLAGDPGTGKTTFLRHMIYKHNLTASVVYDERLMLGDAIFQSFLFDKDDDVLIIEDADVILSSREMTNNKLMSRFLNVSDGLIKLPNKRLVFTTNLNDFGRIDPALIRPGRCFGLINTRKLTFDEAVAAAKAAKLPIPFERREYSLAELFHQGREHKEIRRAGFRR